VKVNPPQTSMVLDFGKVCVEESYESLVWNMLISQLPSKNPGNFQVTVLANQNEIVKVLTAV
jgi:hypothetical protein